jgi:hypothetical protein
MKEESAYAKASARQGKKAEGGTGERWSVKREAQRRQAGRLPYYFSHWVSA